MRETAGSYRRLDRNAGLRPRVAESVFWFRAADRAFPQNHSKYKSHPPSGSNRESRNMRQIATFAAQTVRLIVVTPARQCRDDGILPVRVVFIASAVPHRGTNRFSRIVVLQGSPASTMPQIAESTTPHTVYIKRNPCVPVADAGRQQ